MAKRKRTPPSETAARSILKCVAKHLPALRGKAYTAAMAAQTKLMVAVGDLRSRYKSDNKREMEIADLKAALKKARAPKKKRKMRKKL